MHLKRPFQICLLFTGIFTCIGCLHRPPTKSLEDAAKAIKSARDSGAPKYAPYQYEYAQELLDQAYAQVRMENYSRASEAALKAIEKANKAREECPEKKEELTTLTTKAQKETSIEKQPSKKGPEILDESKISSTSVEEGADITPKSNHKNSLKPMEKDEGIKVAEAQDKRVLKEKEGLKEESLLQRYTVIEGNSLWRIAGYNHIYNDPYLWPLIYLANRDLVKDPNLIYPGQNLIIPGFDSPSEREKALKEADKLLKDIQR